MYKSMMVVALITGIMFLVIPTPFSAAQTGPYDYKEYRDNYGNVWRGEQDIFGNERWEDNHGNRIESGGGPWDTFGRKTYQTPYGYVHCYQDGFGNVTCY